jgi:hypothetical protein
MIFRYSSVLLLVFTIEFSRFYLVLRADESDLSPSDGASSCLAVRSRCLHLVLLCVSPLGPPPQGGLLMMLHSYYLRTC